MAYTYAPRTTNRAGEIIGRGIESIGNNVADAMRDSKLAKEKDKALEERRDRAQTIAEAMGMSSGQAGSMSLGQLEGWVDAQAISRTEEIYDKSKQQDGAFAKAMGMAATPGRTTNHGQEPPPSILRAMQKAGVTDPKYLQAGIAMSDAMKPEYKPRVVDAGNGVQALMTSDNSSMQVRPGAGGMTEPQVKTLPTGEKFYWDGDRWKPYREASDSIYSFGGADAGGSGPDAKVAAVQADLRSQLDGVNADLLRVAADPPGKKYDASFFGIGKGITKQEKMSSLNKHRIELMRALSSGGTAKNSVPPPATGNLNSPVTPVSGAPGGTSFNDEFFSTFGLGDVAEDEEE